MELRRLSWKKLRKARKLQEEEQREVAKSFGAEFMKALSRGDVDEDRARRLIKEQQYNADNFDTEALLESGIAAWSYAEPVNLDTIEELDERTAVWAKQQIIDLTKPPSEDEEKNSSPDSTTP
jgi:hypothetical protein